MADLGFGCPELGSFSLRELTNWHLPFGLSVELDYSFTTKIRLSTWATLSRRASSILWAEAILRAAAQPDPEGPLIDDG